MDERTLTKGSVYYMLQYRSGSPLVTTFEYKGHVDGKPHTHVFIGAGMSQTNIFLEPQDLGSIMDLGELKRHLGT